MQFVPSVWQDIRKYYEGSYVKFTEYGDTLFFIDRVREDSIVGHEEDNNPFVLTLDEEVPYTLTYNLPHKGLFVQEGITYMLHRVPAQQYSRGITTGNTKIVDIVTGKAVSLTFSRLKAFVEKQPYVTLADALFGKTDNRCVALTRRFAFHRTKQTLYVDTFPIATYERKTNTMTTLNTVGKALLPEIKALAAMSTKTEEMQCQ